MRRALSIGIWLGAAIGCQSYDYRKITPVHVKLAPVTYPIGATPLTPNIMLVQDTSGSMCEPLSPNVPLGDGGCAADPTQSKAGLVSTNLAAALTQVDAGATAYNLGLYSFPDEKPDAGPAVAGCGVAGGPIFQIADAGQTLPKIVTWYAGLLSIVNGGTPTAAALLAAASDPALKNPDPRAQNYIILITDGLPNCNDADPCAVTPSFFPWSDGLGHGCESPSYEQAYAAQNGEPPNAEPLNTQCECSLGTCANPADDQGECCTVDPYTIGSSNPDYTLLTQFAAAECLDESNTVSVVKMLYASNVHTYVVGLGSDFAGDAGVRVLTEMAQAGAGGQPDAGYFLATNAQTLAADLSSIIRGIVHGCVYEVGGMPVDPLLIEVTIDDGGPLIYGASNGFSYATGTNEITLGGTACSRILNGQQHSLSIVSVSQ